MTEQYQNIMESLHTLDSDLNAAGWDQPSRLYFLEGEVDDPTARLAGIMPTYPPADMAAAFEQGVRVPDDAHGLIIASEGYRHLSMEEILELKPDMVDTIRAKVEEATGERLEEGRVLDSVKSYYYDTMMNRLPPPGQMPQYMRSEVRTICAVLRDGTTFSHNSTRDKNDASGDIVPVSWLGRQRIPTAAYLFLNDVKPDTECDDPIQVVADMKTLKSMSDLPTTED